MKTVRFIALSALVAFAACTPKVSKKVMIVAKGDITADGAKVTLKGSGSSDKTIELSDETALQVDGSAGKASINIPAEAGLYLANLRPDTLVGAEQFIGTNLSSKRIISQEEIKTNIDSLKQLITGANVSAKNHNYIVLPNQAVKVSGNIKALIFGPFTGIPGSLDADENGKAPEIYKFYTNTEVRALIDNLTKLTVAPR